MAISINSRLNFVVPSDLNLKQKITALITYNNVISITQKGEQHKKGKIIYYLRIDGMKRHLLTL